MHLLQEDEWMKESMLTFFYASNKWITPEISFT